MLSTRMKRSGIHHSLIRPLEARSLRWDTITSSPTLKLSLVRYTATGLSPPHLSSGTPITATSLIPSISDM